jgi:phosphomannomutase/phosphoglucomutase
LTANMATNVPASIFREYDVRGQAIAVSPADRLTLTPDIAKLIGQALGSRHTVGSSALVTGDNRLSTPSLRRSLADGLRAAGLNVLLCEEDVPTGGASWLALTGGYSLVIQVTGSHTPAHYNGFKITERQDNGRPSDEPSATPTALYSRQLASVYDDIVAARLRSHESSGTVRQIDGLAERYQNALVKAAKSLLPGGMYRTAMHVVLDAGNGLGYYLKAVLEALGVGVHGLFLESDGRFPNHPADPLVTRIDVPYRESGLRYACEEVKRRNESDGNGPRWLGIVTDGDGDRSGMVDEFGLPVRPETLGIIFYSHFLDGNVAGLRYLDSIGEKLYMALDVRGTTSFHEVVSRYPAVAGRFIPAGYPIHRTFARGEITKLMELARKLPETDNGYKALNALVHSYVSAEVSGHYFFNLTADKPEVLVDDGLFAALKLLQIIDNRASSETTRSASATLLADMVRALPRNAASEEIRLDCPDDRKFAIVEQVRREAAKRFKDEILPIRPVEMMNQTKTQEPSSGLIEVDGVRVQFKDGSFFLARASNTSPMLTFRFEGPTETILQARYRDAYALLSPFNSDIPNLSDLIAQQGVAT